MCSHHFINNLGEILSELPLVLNSPTFRALLAGLIYRYSLSTFHQQRINLGEISPKLPLSPNLPAFWGPSSWVNLFALIILSTTFAKFHQNCHFRRFHQIRQLFRALLAGLILLSTFCQQPWQNFAKIVSFAVFTNVLGPI